MRRALPALALLVGCAPATEVQWLEGFGFGWDLFNHRVNHVSLAMLPNAADVAVVGGTSTTGEEAELDPSCDPETCDEFPFADTAFVDVWAGRAEVRGARTGVGMASLVVGAEGGDAVVEVDLGGRARGALIALIDGFSIDTDEPLASGPACYDPAFGWHPRRIALAVGEPALLEGGRVARVPVSAAFEAGNSLEEARGCVDEVAADARVAITVDVRVVAAEGALRTAELAHGMAWALGAGGSSSPDPQPDPDLAARAVELDWDGPVGFTSVDFRFHVDDPEDRGAYLRTWSFRVDELAGAASGHATNWSPGTQLSGFDYAFTGAVVSLSLGAEVTRRVASDQIGSELNGVSAEPTRVPLVRR